MQNAIPTLAIIGRVNVGKSTLFNRLIEKKHALVSDIAGTTRDPNRNFFSWRGYTYRIIDTAGVIERPQKGLEADIQEQTDLALHEANLILFVVDGKVPPLPADTSIIKRLQKAKKQFLLVVNKADKPHDKLQAQTFLSLGVNTIYPVSSINGTGTGDLLDAVRDSLKGVENFQEQKAHIRVAIIGRTNVGKSTLLNSLTQKKLVITGPAEHTTREPIDTFIEYKDKIIQIVDTAGLKRKEKIQTEFEQSISKKTLAALERAEVALFIIDGSITPSMQDKNILNAIVNEYHVSVILLINKLDLMKKGEETRKEYERILDLAFPFTWWAPRVYISAKTQRRVSKILDQVIELAEARTTAIPENALYKFIKKVISLQKPTRRKGTNDPYIHALHQVYVNPPKFEVVIGNKESLSLAYVKFIERKLREKFNFTGAPISIFVKNLKHGEL